MVTGASYSGEIKPRNMVWVEDMPPDFTSVDYGHLSSSYYTHAIVCFFHLADGPTLVYNNGKNPYDPFYFNWWTHLRSLQVAPQPKTLFMSVGGWGSGTWERVQGLEAQGAAEIVKFARDQGFDGIDFNFEGAYEPNRDARLTSFARLVLEVRKIWSGLFTITPIAFQVWEQLQHIQNAVGHSFAWSDYLSWINVQFYTYQNSAPQPMPNVPGYYQQLLSSFQLPATMVTAGFPLSETDLQFNQNEMRVALGAVKDIFSAHPDFAGMFVWRFRGAFLGNLTNQEQDWAYHFSQILHNR